MSTLSVRTDAGLRQVCSNVPTLRVYVIRRQSHYTWSRFLTAWRYVL
jgi:hypothetical protein